MAQLLNEYHSTNVHLNITKRHIRMTRQVKGAEELTANIEPSYNDLAEKAVQAKVARAETESRRDFLSLKDAMLDDKVRDLHGAGKKYERDNPGASVMNVLFPEGLSPVIYGYIETEPSLVEKLILGVQSLGEGHALAGHIAILQTAIDEVKTAITELHEAISAEKTAVALVSIAKMNLARQYEQNTYAAGAKFGKSFASHLFPAINRSSKKNIEEEIES